MKKSPEYIVLWVVSRYLNQSEYTALKNELVKYHPIGRIKFFNTLKTHFDLEKMRTNPIDWRDIWIYNYLTIDPKSKISRKPLLTDYEREVMNPIIKDEAAK